MLDYFSYQSREFKLVIKEIPGVKRRKQNSSVMRRDLRIYFQINDITQKMIWKQIYGKFYMKT